MPIFAITLMRVRAGGMNRDRCVPHRIFARSREPRLPDSSARRQNCVFDSRVDDTNVQTSQCAGRCQRAPLWYVSQPSPTSH